MSPALHSVCRNAKLDTQIATQKGEDSKLGQEYIIKICIVKVIKALIWAADSCYSLS